MPSDAPLSDHDASGHLTSPYYGYLPTSGVNLLFLVLFGLSTSAHFVQAIRARAWWLLPTVLLAGCGELIGWGAREWSHYAPLAHNPYLIQIVTLIISPTPLIGALFITFGRLSARLGHEYSRLSPRLYSRIFLTCDVVALVVQAAGGAIAAGADDAKGSKLGSNIMLGGIVFQLASLSVFCVLVAEYMFRRIKDKPFTKTMNASGSTETFVPPTIAYRGPIEKPLMHLALGLCMEALFLYIRGIYRTVELADGWDGRVIQTQSLFIIFDGVMVFLTMLTMNIFHPGRLLSASSGAIMKGAIPLSSKVSSV
ncbi:RTA1-like protein [Lenzites betulinus]|nr:RTA1-like protein [Lenzites betulinus]